MDALIDKMKIPPSLLGKLNETNINKSTNSELRNSLEKDGYLFLRNIFHLLIITIITKYSNSPKLKINSDYLHIITKQRLILLEMMPIQNGIYV